MAVPQLLARSVRAVYSGVMWLAQPLLRRKLMRRARAEPGYAEAIDERFGHYTQPAERGRVWVHAVSLGETRAAAILLAQLRQRDPQLRLLLTHGTATGRAEGRKLLQAGDVQVWQPWDTPGAVHRFLAHFQPRLGLLMETEVWPNLTAACKQRGVPLMLANARLNAQSLHQAQRMAWLAYPAYQALTAVWAQTEADAQRLRTLGAPVQGVYGNLKFDATPDAALLAQGRRWRAATARPVVMLASSREGEEALFLTQLHAQRTAPRATAADAWAQVQYLIVPRHPQRFDEVAALIAQHGFALARRSTWGELPPTPVVHQSAEAVTTAAPSAATTGPVIWLGDSLGEMALYYALADVALLGGSFAPLGGQNLIEAAACACPVIMGPHTFNFAEAAQLAQEAGAALRVADMSAALAQAQALVRDAARHRAAVNAASGFTHLHRGAAARMAQAALTWPAGR
jgi:3-deoxy-D-manno-octulosonic-acid transferase